MSQEKWSVTSRRAWLAGTLRYGALGGLGVMSAVLATRRSGHSCPRLSIPCQACGLWSACELPRAKAVREPRVTKGQG